MIFNILSSISEYQQNNKYLINIIAGRADCWLAADEMHKLNEAVTRPRQLSNDGWAPGSSRQDWPSGEAEQGNVVPRHDGGEINRNQISPQGIWDEGKIKSRQDDDDDGEIVYQIH